MPKAIGSITETPEAFEQIAAKVNELIVRSNTMASPNVREPLSYQWSEGGAAPLWTLDIQKLTGMLQAAGPLPVPGGGLGDPAGSGSNGLPYGYTFRAFTVCSNGTPTTYYWPTWDSNPT
jgi:hypothetical protein